MVPPLTMCAYMKKGSNLRWSLIQCSGGDEGDRTPDLLTASQALSQLSYAPVRKSTIRELGRRCKDNFGKTFAATAAGARPRPGPRAPPPASPAPSGRLESSRPPFFAFAARAATRSTAIPPAPGPLLGPIALPPGRRFQTIPVYGARPGTPEHAVIGKIKAAGRRLAHSEKCRVWTAGPGPAP